MEGVLWEAKRSTNRQNDSNYLNEQYVNVKRGSMYKKLPAEKPVDFIVSLSS